MASPNIPQGNLSRVKGSLIFPEFPSLNVTASFLGKEGFSCSFAGPATDRLPTMTGGVNSPSPYRVAAMSVHLVKSQGLCQAWKLQEESLTILGPAIFRLDVGNFPPYQFDNCSLDGIQNLTVNGMDPNYVISIGGYYYINDQIWN